MLTRQNIITIIRDIMARQTNFKITWIGEICHDGLCKLAVGFSDMITAISKLLQQLCHTLHNVWLKQPIESSSENTWVKKPIAKQHLQTTTIISVPKCQQGVRGQLESGFSSCRQRAGGHMNRADTELIMYSGNASLFCKN